MTNGERYRTADERYHAFHDTFTIECNDCQYSKVCSYKYSECSLRWLERECVEKPLPCPFCRGKCSTEIVTSEDSETREKVETFNVVCHGTDNDGCGYSSKGYTDESKAIAAHNRVARAML